MPLAPDALHASHVPSVPLQTVYLYIDAMGRSREARVWGGLIVIGDQENQFLSYTLDHLKAVNSGLLDPKTRELKGSSMPPAQLVSALQLIRGHRVYFWSRPTPGYRDLPVLNFHADTIGFLDSLFANKRCANWKSTELRRTWLTSLLRSLTPHHFTKFMSLVATSHHLVDFLHSNSFGPYIGQVHLLADDEGFPRPLECAWALKWFVTAQLQGAGMSSRLTGDAVLEEPDEGSVRLCLHCNSADVPGIQYADILIHGAVRRLSGFLQQGAVPS